MAFEIAPLTPNPPVKNPNVSPEDYRITLAGRLFQAGNINIREAVEISGIEQSRLESILLSRGMIKRNKILVCGGAGFIGSNFVYYLLEKYPYDEVVVYDKLTYAGNLENLSHARNNPRYSFYKGDIADFTSLEKVVKDESVDYIVNFAAETHVTRSLMRGADEFLRSNILGVHSLLEVLRSCSFVKRMVHISTDEVYGTLEIGEDRSFFETDPFEPNVPYSAAKAGGDLLTRAWRHSYDVPVITTHCTNNYGAFQHPEKLIPNSLFRALMDKPITIHGKGQHIRDWLYVGDHCRAIDMILREGKDGEVYNIAAQEEHNVLEVARALLRLLGKSEDLITFVDDRPGNDLRYSLNTKKIENELGWKPSVPFEDGIKATIKWYENNMKWIESILEKDKEFSKYV